MKTKLKIDLLKNGIDTKNLSSIIANHNSGINPVSLDDISSWLWCQRSIWDVCKSTNAHAEKDEYEDSKLLVKENDEVIAIIEEIEIHELQEEENSLTVG